MVQFTPYRQIINVHKGIRFQPIIVSNEVILEDFSQILKLRVTRKSYKVNENTHVW